MSVLAIAAAGVVTITALALTAQRSACVSQPRGAPCAAPSRSPAGGGGRTGELAWSRPLTPAGARSCSQRVSSAAAADAAVRSARPAAVICLRAGTYAGLELSGQHARDVTLEAAPGRLVTLTPGATRVAVYLAPFTTHVVLHGFHIVDGIQLGAGDSAIRIDHNDITGSTVGIWLNSSNCLAPNAPSWSGCQPGPVISGITISGNRIHDLANGVDGIDLDNFFDVRVTGNEIDGIVDHGGQHTDCLQTTFGGTGLVFDRNYEHDNNCQGFFTKDGDVSEAVLYDNLFLRDQVARVPEQNIDIVDVYRLVMRQNTSWPGTGDIIRDLGSAQPPHATIRRNVFEAFANGCCG